MTLTSPQSLLRKTLVVTGCTVLGASLVACSSNSDSDNSASTTTATSTDVVEAMENTQASGLLGTDTAVTPPGPENTCNAGDLDVSVADTESGAGSIYFTLNFVNSGSESCTIQGYPGVTLLDSNNNPIGSTAQREQLFDTDNADGSSVILEPGASANANVKLTNARMYAPEDCSITDATSLEIYPPGQTEPVTVEQSGFQGCANGSQDLLDVQPVTQQR